MSVLPGAFLPVGIPGFLWNACGPLSRTSFCRPPGGHAQLRVTTAIVHLYCGFSGPRAGMPVRSSGPITRLGPSSIPTVGPISRSRNIRHWRVKVRLIRRLCPMPISACPNLPCFGQLIRRIVRLRYFIFQPHVTGATVTHHGPAPTTARAIGHLVEREPLFLGIQLLGRQWRATPTVGRETGFVIFSDGRFSCFGRLIPILC